MHYGVWLTRGSPRHLGITPVTQATPLISLSGTGYGRVPSLDGRDRCHLHDKHLGTALKEAICFELGH